MSNSSLVTYTNITSHRTSPRQHVVDTLTIHCYVGQVTAKQGCDYFKTTNREASATYVVGCDGSIGLSVPEADRPWTSSNKTNDHRAITIEVACDPTHPYHVNDVAMKSLIKLCADICKRNRIKKLIWSDSKSDRVNHRNGCNMTVHRDFASTACPGDYLYSKQAYIASEVNKKLSGNTAKWVRDNVGWWYQRADGSYPKSQWLLLDCYYYFNDKGYALANEWLSYGGNWYWLKDDCRMATGWQYIDKHWYYLNPTGTKNKPVGAMLDGWQFIDGQWYYLRTKADGEHPHGSMVEGSVTVGDYDYYCRVAGEDKNYPTGSMLTGWHKVVDEENKTKWFWYNKDANCQPVGSMLKNHWLTTENGKKYYLKDDGEMACNETIEISGKEYSFDASGALER